MTAGAGVINLLNWTVTGPGYPTPTLIASNTNQQEYLAGTDPKNAADALRITAITHAGVAILITFTSATGKFYELLRSGSPSLRSPVAVSNNIPGTGNPVQLADPGAARPAARTISSASGSTNSKSRLRWSHVAVCLCVAMLAFRGELVYRAGGMN